MNGEIMKKRKVLITGAGSGLGKMAAIRLARRGHKVIATVFYEEEVDILNEISKNKNLDITVFKMDIRNKEEREKILNYDFDVLINNAAIGDSGSVCEAPIEKYRDVYETNVFSNILITQIAFNKFYKQGYGRIIFISSLVGRVSMPFLSPYSSSKFAIEGLAESLQMELKFLNNKKIDVTLIEPGAYATGFNMDNINKMYGFMDNNTYFKDNLDRIKKFETKLWNIIECKTFDSVIKKYVKAVESKHLRKRYHSPLIQYIIVKLILIFK